MSLLSGEKKAFVIALCNRIRDETIKAIPQMPEEWDGHELRCLLAEKFHDAASVTLIKRFPRDRRALNYRNTLDVTNL